MGVHQGVKHPGWQAYGHIRTWKDLSGRCKHKSDHAIEWMDSWQVYSKTRAAHAAGESSVPHLRGDALLVEKSEASSALIYWNGKRYVWSQRGD